MRPARLLPILAVLLIAREVHAQEQASLGVFLAQDRMELAQLLEGSTTVSGQGKQATGIDLATTAWPRYRVGDDSSYAARAFTDTTWASLGALFDTVVPGATVHWVRYHVLPGADLDQVRLQLGVETRAVFDLYLNGERLMQAHATAGGPLLRGLPRTDSLPRTELPLRFRCDGRPEVLALRLVVPAGTALRSSGLRVTLHAPGGIYRRNRQLMHFGVFIGVNATILLLALVLGWTSRGERSWRLLALLSFVTALDTWCDVAGDSASLGLPAIATSLLDALGTTLMAWPFYLLIMVLGHMRGDLSPRRARWYAIAAWGSSAFGVLVALGYRLDLLVTGPSDHGYQGPMTYLVLLILAGLVFAGALGWFAIDVVRLGLRLWRSSDLERWIGGGALASSLLSLFLNALGDFSGFTLGSWLALLADYCSNVAVPASVAVYLAIRSAHHNRLVSRQRDELDAEVRERTAELRTEKERSDELLLNILPEEVADELKAKGEAEAKHFDQATILFTDFKGFTQLSEKVTPAELVAELNTCFKAFDGIMEKYRIEKIKTIGDAYMAAGGLPDPQHGSPADVIRAALEMRDFMQQHKAEREAAGKPFFEMRVGIHTGPVVAGIVGVKKFQYDIWGDTVNTASRMESSGEVGQVNISEATHALVKDASTPLGMTAFTFTPRGKVQAKGKGEMEMFFVERA